MIELVTPGRFVALLLPFGGAEGPAAPIGSADTVSTARSHLIDLLALAPRGSCGLVWDAQIGCAVCGVSR